MFMIFLITLAPLCGQSGCNCCCRLLVYYHPSKFPLKSLCYTVWSTQLVLRQRKKEKTTETAPVSLAGITTALTTLYLLLFIYIHKTIRNAPRCHSTAYNAGLALRNMDEYKAASYSACRSLKQAESARAENVVITLTSQHLRYSLRYSTSSQNSL